MAAMDEGAKDVHTIRALVEYLESDFDPDDLPESLPYGAWRCLLHTLASTTDQPAAAAAIISTILRSRPSMEHSRHQAAHRLVVELVLAVSPTCAGSIASLPHLQPVLSTTARSYLSNPESAQVQRGLDVLMALSRASDSFCQYAAGCDSVLTALASAQRISRAAAGASWAVSIGDVLEQLLASPAATAAFLQSLSRLVSATSATGQPLKRARGSLRMRAQACCLLDVLLSASPGTCRHAAGLAATQGGLVQDVLQLLVECSAAVTAQAAAQASAGAAGPASAAVNADGAAPAPAAGPKSGPSTTAGAAAALKPPVVPVKGSAPGAGTLTQRMQAAGDSADKSAGAPTCPVHPDNDPHKTADTPAPAAGPSSSAPGTSSVTATRPAVSPVLAKAAEKVSEAIKSTLPAAAAKRQAESARAAQSAHAPAATSASPSATQVAAAKSAPILPRASGAGASHQALPNAPEPGSAAATLAAAAAALAKAASLPRPAGTAGASAASVSGAAGSAHKPMTLLTVQSVLRTLCKCTQQQPQQVAGLLVAREGLGFHTLVKLLELATGTACSPNKCSALAANVISACLCADYEASSSRKGDFLPAEFTDLLISTPGALEAIVRLLEGYELPTRGVASTPAWVQGKFDFAALVRGLAAVVKCDNSKAGPQPERRSAPSRGDNNCVDSTPSGPSSSAPGGPAPGALATWLVDRPMLWCQLQGLLRRTTAGLLTLLLDPLYPSCSPAQQRQLALQLESECFIGKGKKQYVNHLAELLEYPPAGEAEVRQLPAAAHMILQIVSTHPGHALKASYHKKSPGALSPGHLGSPTKESPTDKEPSSRITSLISGLLAAVQVRHAHNCSAVTAAALAEAAVHSADALGVLAGNAAAAEELAHPAAVQKLMDLVAAAGQDRSCEHLQDSSLASRHRQALLKLPFTVCQLAILQPSVPQLLEQHQGAVDTLAAALLLSQSDPLGAECLQLRAQTAAQRLCQQWPQLQEAMDALQQQQHLTELQSEPSLSQLQQLDWQPGSPPRQQQQPPAADAAIVSLCDWSPAKSGCQAQAGDAADLQDTAGSQPQHSDGPQSSGFVASPASPPGNPELALLADPAADAVVFVVPGSGGAASGKADSAAQHSLDPTDALAFWGSGVKQSQQPQQQHTQEAAGAGLLPGSQQHDSADELLPLLSSSYLLRQQQHTSGHPSGAPAGAARQEGLSLPFFGGFMLTPQHPQQDGLGGCAEGPLLTHDGTMFGAPQHRPTAHPASDARAATATAATPAEGLLTAAVGTAAGASQSSRGLPATGRSSSLRRTQGLHAGLAAMLTPSMYAPSVQTELPVQAPDKSAGASVTAAPAAVAVAAAEHGAPLAAPAASAAAAPSSQRRGSPKRSRQQLEGEPKAADDSEPASEQPPAKVPARSSPFSAVAAAGSFSATYNAIAAMRKRMLAARSAQQQEVLPPLAALQPAGQASTAQDTSMQPPQRQAEPSASEEFMQPQQEAEQAEAAEDETTEVEDSDDDSHSEADWDSECSSTPRGAAAAAASSAPGVGDPKKKREHPYFTVWKASQAPRVQALLSSLGFFGPNAAASPAKAMLQESITDGRLHYAPHANLKKIPRQLRHSAQASACVVAARMQRRKQKPGAVWGYGWGSDRDSAEAMAAEAAVANMYVCGVRFKQLPPYDGPAETQQGARGL